MIPPIIIITMVSALISGGLIWVILSSGLSLGGDQGDVHRKAQSEVIPHFGGAAIVLTFLLVFGVMALFILDLSPEKGLAARSLLVCCVMMFAVGFVDDLLNLPAVVKLGLQLVVALTAYHLGLRIEFLSAPFSGEALELGAYGLPITLLWLVLIPNVLNLVDGLDGLAGGISLFLCLTIGAMAFLMGNVLILSASAVMTGAVLGFLCFNLPPARIYLGDAGSHLLGFFIAAGSLLTSGKGSVAASLIVVLFALSFPILDATFAVVRRIVTGVPFWKPDAGHLHHRLMTIGVSKRSIILVLYGVFFMICAAALASFVVGGYAFLALAMFCGILALRLFKAVGCLKSWGDCFRMVKNRLKSRRQIQFAHSLSDVLNHEIYRCNSSREFWEAFRITVAKTGILPVSEATRAGAVSMSLANGGSWHFRHALDDRFVDVTDWERVAERFLPVVSEALKKWPNVRHANSLGFELPTIEGAPTLPTPRPESRKKEAARALADAI